MFIKKKQKYCKQRLLRNGIFLMCTYAYTKLYCTRMSEFHIIRKQLSNFSLKSSRYNISNMRDILCKTREFRVWDKETNRVRAMFVCRV